MINLIKSVIITAILTLTIQSASAAGISGDIRHVGVEDKNGFSNLNIFYNDPTGKTDCYTFLDASNNGYIFGETTCTMKTSLGNTGLKLRGQVTHNNSLFSKGAIGITGDIPFSDSVPLFVNLAYFPSILGQGNSFGSEQKLEWFAEYTGKLPLNASLYSFGGFVYASGKGVSMEYGEINLKIPLFNSNFFVGGTAALIPNGKMIPEVEGKIQIGISFNF